MNIKIKSKRNNVYLVEFNGELAIEKGFNDTKSYIIEKKFYINLDKKNINCPNLLDFSDGKEALWLSYIPGKTALELIEKYEKEGSVNIATELLKKIINWLFLFHSSFPKSIIFDVSLSNFILIDDEIFGIDFEQIRVGNQKKDIIKLVTMFSYYHPENSRFKQKIELKIKKFLMSKGIFSEKEISTLMEDEVKLILQRRKLREKFL
jgi:tRNA A-37 threonylcarbamoyl transferase component Bud32